MPRPVLSRSQKLSQFFTRPNIAQAVIEVTKTVLTKQGLNWNTLRFIECAAGDGGFTQLLPPRRTLGVEVDPVLLERHPEFLCANLETGGFLGLSAADLHLSDVPRSKIVIGFNPPFSVPKHNGRSNNVALEFINHAATMADTIAMILPNTFRRPLTQSKIDRRFHLIYDSDVPTDAFTVDGEVVKITTVFQIWRAKDIPRQDDPFLKIVKNGQWGGDWRYVKSTDPTANIRICNWGSHATVGRLDGPRQVPEITHNNVTKYQERVNSGQPMKNYDPDQSHYYLCARDPNHTYDMFAQRKYLFEELAQDRTSGNNPDLTYGDMVRIYLSPLGTHYKQGKWITDDL